MGSWKGSGAPCAGPEILESLLSLGVGPATIRLLATGGVVPSPDGLENCFEGATIKLVPRDNNLVATLQGDLSFLYGGSIPRRRASFECCSFGTVDLKETAWLT